MLFTSIQYLLFLPTVVLLYWIIPSKWRLPMLLAASYIFYMSWIPAFIMLILPMTIFNYVWGSYLHKSADEKKKLIFSIGVAANLITLAIFKYSNFFIQTGDWVFHLASGKHVDYVANIILPLGISFFTFEFIHYLFEIYRGNKPIQSFTLFALFAAFFPTQIAGPIKRYPDFVAQMQSSPKFQLSYFDEGLPLIVVGLAKKILLADNLAMFVQAFCDGPKQYGAIETWIFAYAFAFQIYFDFSGYTDIGRGSAMLFGYHIPINFNIPYLAQNISDFWRRWHISLSTWLRDYLFIPLGGSRGGRWATNRNLFWTMALGGLWHGASWNFVVWGIYHGTSLILHREFVAWRDSVVTMKKLSETWAYRWLSVIFTFNVVCVGWIFFRVQNIETALRIVKTMVTFRPLLREDECGQFFVLNLSQPIYMPAVFVMTLLLLVTTIPLGLASEKGVYRRLPAPLTAAFCTVLILAMIAFLPDTSKPFIYFQF